MRIWTAISTEGRSGKRYHNVFNSGFDYAEARGEFKRKFPTHQLEALAPGHVEMQTYDNTPPPSNDTGLDLHPLDGMPSGF